VCFEKAFPINNYLGGTMMIIKPVTTRGAGQLNPPWCSLIFLKVVIIHVLGSDKPKSVHGGK
jgi:hypothetical protein